LLSHSLVAISSTLTYLRNVLLLHTSTQHPGMLQHVMSFT